MVRELVRVAVILLVASWMYAAFMHSGKPRNPLSRTEAPSQVSDTAIAEEPAPTQDPPNNAAANQPTPKEPASKDAWPDDAPTEEIFVDDNRLSPSSELLASIKDYVDTPKGAIDWQLFGQTKQRTYTISGKDGARWMGLRPVFTNELKRFDGRSVLIKGYMFPLGQQEKQPTFLLGPFPVSCPYHYDVTPSLIIEVQAKTPVTFSYEAISVRGELELVPKDDEYNVFYRLKKAKRVP